METNKRELKLDYPYLPRQNRFTRDTGRVDGIAIACAARDKDADLFDAQTRRMMEIPQADRLAIAKLLSEWHWRGERYPDWTSPIRYDPVTSDARMTDADQFRNCVRAAVQVVLRDDVRGTFTRERLEELRRLVIQHDLLSFVCVPSLDYRWFTSDAAESLIGAYEQA